MKSALFIFIFLAMILPNQASAQKKNVGVGIILDDPVRISVKKWLGKTTAIDGALALKADGKNADSGAYGVQIDVPKIHSEN